MSIAHLFPSKYLFIMMARRNGIMENYDQLLAYLCTRLEHFDNDCVTFLRKHSKKYVETEQKMK